MERILGVNLSGWFIPEPWVTPSLYAATGASNAAELQEAMGTAAYNERMRRHYETFVSEDDFRRMAQIGLNAVRLPVPWYAFGSQESDASYISVVDYLDRAIEWAAKYDIRVLLDLATVPGGQGDSNDSPTTPEAVAEWHSSTNGRHVALGVLERLADRYGEAERRLGIELLDKPTIYWDFHSLLLGIQMMFSFMLVDGGKPLRLCKHCQKVFLSSRSNSAFCSPRCKNQYNVYKSRGKNKGQDGENDD